MPRTVDRILQSRFLKSDIAGRDRINLPPEEGLRIGLNGIGEAEEVLFAGIAGPLREEVDEHGIQRMVAVILSIFWNIRLGFPSHRVLALGARAEKAVQAVFATNPSGETAGDNSDPLLSLTIDTIAPPEVEPNNFLCES